MENQELFKLNITLPADGDQVIVKYELNIAQTRATSQNACPRVPGAASLPTKSPASLQAKKSLKFRNLINS